MKVNTAIVNAAGKAETEVPGTGSPTAVFVCDVVLHAGSRVDLQLPRINRASESLVVSAGILSIGIAPRIVNMFFGSIDAESLLGDFEFLGGIAVRQK